jgi:hypothetical protein
MSQLPKNLWPAPAAFTIVPPIFPSETILGHVMRIAMVSGGSNIKPLARKLFGLSTIEPPLIIPSNLTQYVNETTPVFADADEAIREHTLYSIMEPYLAPEARSVVIEHLRHGSAARSVYAYLGFANKNATSRASLRMCTMCVISDEARCGVAFWHREHQLPGVSSCGHHSVALVTGCGTCETSLTSSRVLRLPRTTCWCGKPHKTILHFQTDHAKAADVRISRMLIAALRAPLPSTLLPFDWCDFYNSKAKALGYAKGRNLATPKIEADFLELFGEELLTQYGAHGRQGCLWLRRAVTRVAPFASCIKHLLLADFLFGSWDEYSNAAMRHKEHSTFTAREPGPANGTPLAAAAPELLNRHRSTIRKFSEGNPGATRTQARIRYGSAVNFLCKFDKGWLDKMLPTRRNNSFRGLQSSTQYLASLEIELLSAATGTYDLLTHAKTRPRRITRRALFVGATRGQEAVSGNFVFPKLEELLKGMIESKLQYQLRRARWILNNPSSVPEGSTPLRFASHSTGLSQEKIIRELAVLESAARRG